MGMTRIYVIKLPKLLGKFIRRLRKMRAG